MKDKLIWYGLISILILCFTGSVNAQKPDEPAPDKWGAEAKTIWYQSEADGTYQPAVFFAPKTDKPVPLIVGLHSWSADYKQANVSFLRYAKIFGWAMICPNFRGPNTKPEGCGSDLVVKDVKSAVDYMKKRCKIDSDRIYLMGSSGGGHLSMLLAGRLPEIWAGVCAWVGISDLARWYEDTKSQDLVYYKHLEQVCGGAPGSNSKVDHEYKYRSPVTWLAAAKNVPLCLNGGIHDGHRKSSVPCTHSIRAFNVLAQPEKRISEEDMTAIFQTETIPEHLQKEAVADPAYGTRSVLFRRTSGNVRITIFDGGHEGILSAGFQWFNHQRKGKPADWTPVGVFQNPQIEKISK